MEVHKIPKSSEIADLDLYLADAAVSTQQAERLPHPSMSLFQKPPTNRYPKLAAGREVARGKVASKTPAAGRKTQKNLPEDVEKLRQNMEKAKSDKREKAYVWPDSSWTGMELTYVRTVPSSSILRWPLVQSVVPRPATRNYCRARRAA